MCSPVVSQILINSEDCTLQMDELTTLMAAMCQFIDIVGSYQLPPEARKKAEKRRQEVNLKSEMIQAMRQLRHVAPGTCVGCKCQRSTCM
jgi:Protein of unknown function (DUF1682)